MYRITGKKQWTTNGSQASVLTVMAKTKVSGEDKITAFIVTPDMKGFKVTDASLDKVGMRGTRTSNLEFQDMHVPESHILGPIGGGLKVCLTVLDYGRTTFGATCTGAAKFAIECAIHHAKTRFQFKRALASFALVKKKIAIISALTYAMEATTYLTAGLVDAHAEDIMLESAMLKVFASESLWEIIYETMQIYGGKSFFKSSPLERMMRDARLNMVGEGANEVMLAFVGLVGMRDVGMELKETVNFIKHPGSSFKLMLNLVKRISLPKISVKSKKLNKETLLLKKAIRRFGISIIKVLAKHKEEIFEKQLVLERIAKSAIAIYTSTAVLSKLDSEVNDLDLKRGKFYIHYALKKLDVALDSLFINEDEMMEELSDEIVGLKV